MLYIVLFLVVAALAGVVAALITANSLWAWISIGLSVLAGVILLVDLFRRRPGGTAATEPAEPEAESAEAESAEAGTESDEADDTAASAGETSGSTAGTLVGHGSEADAPSTAQSAPSEEDTDAADALIVSSLEEEVLVVDEYPRYHLSACGWLADRETIPIAVSEARDLGFGPCARCTPDATLAAQHRKTRRKFRTGADG